MKEIQQNNIQNHQNSKKVDLLLDEQMKRHCRALQNSKKSKLIKKNIKFNIKGQKKTISIHDFVYYQCVQLARVHAGITRQNQAPIKRYCCQYCSKNFQNSKKLGGHINSCRKKLEKTNVNPESIKTSHKSAKNNMDELDSTKRDINHCNLPTSGMEIQNCKPCNQKSELESLLATKPQECQSIFNNVSDQPHQSNEYQPLDSFFY